jgi:SH3 domain-containing YSC84-like protein 1
MERFGSEDEMKSLSAILIAILSGTLLAVAQDNSKETERLEESGKVLKEILNIPDNIPSDLLNRAECVIVFPSVKKFAIGIGGSYGRGAIVCRTGQNFTGPWSAPAMFALEGANIGFQLGGQATDFVLLVMNPRGAESVLKSKVKLGGDASAAAGPKGRTAAAQTDIVMRAEILSYSRSRGLFAGISLEGSTLRQDNGANKKIYGQEIGAREIVREGKAKVPSAGRQLVSLLNQKSPRNLSDPKSLQ